MLGTTVKHGLAIVVGLSFKMVEEKVKQCVTGCFSLVHPPKSSKYKKVNLG